jgi:hypothetical protein
MSLNFDVTGATSLERVKRFRLWSRPVRKSAVETSHKVVIAAMLQAMSIDKWSLLTNAITLLVITATALAALIQLRHLRAQNTLNAELAILKDWNDPQFRHGDSTSRVRCRRRSKIRFPSRV